MLYITICFIVSKNISCYFLLFCFVLFLIKEKTMAPHSTTLAWKIPWMEEPGRLQSMGLLRVRHNWATSLSLFTFLHWRRKWQPTLVFLPGESQGRGSLWGRTESDTTEVTAANLAKESLIQSFYLHPNWGGWLPLYLRILFSDFKLFNFWLLTQLIWEEMYLILWKIPLGELTA